MAHTIRFKNTLANGSIRYDEIMTKIILAARKEKWTGNAGFKEWAKVHYRAELRSGVTGYWNSISFKREEDMVRFKQDFGIAG